MKVVYNDRFDRSNARFCVQEDKWKEGSGFLAVYDRDKYMIVGYFECDDLSTAKEVCDYCNSLNDELMSTYKELASYRSIVGYDKGELLERIQSLEKELGVVKGRCEVELRYCREVLLDCLACYPDSKGLVDFKNAMGWQYGFIYYYCI